MRPVITFPEPFNLSQMDSQGLLIASVACSTTMLLVPWTNRSEDCFLYWRFCTAHSSVNTMISQNSAKYLPIPFLKDCFNALEERANTIALSFLSKSLKSCKTLSQYAFQLAQWYITPRLLGFNNLKICCKIWQAIYAEICSSIKEGFFKIALLACFCKPASYSFSICSSSLFRNSFCNILHSLRGNSVHFIYSF